MWCTGRDLREYMTDRHTCLFTSVSAFTCGPGDVRIFSASSSARLMHLKWNLPTSQPGTAGQGERRTSRCRHRTLSSALTYPVCIHSTTGVWACSWAVALGSWRGNRAAARGSAWYLHARVPAGTFAVDVTTFSVGLSTWRVIYGYSDGKWKEKSGKWRGGICLFFHLLFPPHLSTALYIVSSWRKTTRRRRKQHTRHHRRATRSRRTRCPPSPSTTPTSPRSSPRWTTLSGNTSSTSPSRRRSCTRPSTSPSAIRPWCSRSRLWRTRCV